MVRKIIYYKSALGREPFFAWFDQLDIRLQVVIDRYVGRVAQGGSKNNVTPIKGGDGVKEIRVAKLGIRVYFAEPERLMLVLIGGDKDTQRQDVKTAKLYWRDYREQQKCFV